MAKNTFNDFSTTASSNTDIGGIDIQGTAAVANFDNALRTLMAILRTDLDNGQVFVTKAAGYTADADDNNAFYEFTAAATLALTAAATLAADWHMMVFANGGAVTIDPDGAELINGAATLVVADGNAAFIICTGSAFKAITIPSAARVQDKDVLAFGQWSLTLSGGDLLLARSRGRLITINGVHESIPSAGVTLAASGLTPATLYYIYAYMNTGTMTLEASATAYAVDSTTGVVIKSGDATRTLVGMVYPETGPVFTNTPKKRFVRSWNDNGVVLFNNFTANRSTTAPHATPQEVNNEIRCQFLLWAGESVEATINGSVTTATVSGGVTASVAFNSTTTPEATGAVSIIAAANTVLPISAAAFKEGLTEGLNYATLMGWAAASGQVTFYGDSDGRRTSLRCRVSR